MTKVIASLILGFALLLNTGIAHSQNIDENFARKLVYKWTDGKVEGSTICNSVYNQLNKLDKEQLSQLKAIIQKDMKTEAGRVVGKLPYQRRLTTGLVRKIDDIQGNLSYDIVLDGEISESHGSGSGIAWYIFKFNNGETRKLYIGVDTLFPYCGFREKRNIPYKFYIKGKAVVKIEEI